MKKISDDPPKPYEPCDNVGLARHKIESRSRPGTRPGIYPFIENKSLLKKQASYFVFKLLEFITNFTKSALAASIPQKWFSYENITFLLLFTFVYLQSFKHLFATFHEQFQTVYF